MFNPPLEHHFRPRDRELSRIAAQRYARGGSLEHGWSRARRPWRTRPGGGRSPAPSLTPVPPLTTSSELS